MKGYKEALWFFFKTLCGKNAKYFAQAFNGCAAKRLLVEGYKEVLLFFFKTCEENAEYFARAFNECAAKRLLVKGYKEVLLFFFKTLCGKNAEFFARALLKQTAIGLGEDEFIAKLELVKAKIEEKDSETKSFEDLMSDQNFIEVLRKRSLDELEKIESLAAWSDAAITQAVKEKYEKKYHQISFLALFYKWFFSKEKKKGLPGAAKEINIRTNVLPILQRAFGFYSGWGDKLINTEKLPDVMGTNIHVQSSVRWLILFSVLTKLKDIATFFDVCLNYFRKHRKIWREMTFQSESITTFKILKKAIKDARNLDIFKN